MDQHASEPSAPAATGQPVRVLSGAMVVQAVHSVLRREVQAIELYKLVPNVAWPDPNVVSNAGYDAYKILRSLENETYKDLKKENNQRTHLISELGTHVRPQTRLFGHERKLIDPTEADFRIGLAKGFASQYASYLLDKHPTFDILRQDGRLPQLSKIIEEGRPADVTPDSRPGSRRSQITNPFQTPAGSSSSLQAAAGLSSNNPYAGRGWQPGSSGPQMFPAQQPAAGPSPGTGLTK